MKLTVLAHVVEIVLIAFLLLHIFVLAPMQSQPSSSSLSEVSFVNLGNPPDLQGKITVAEDAISDLTSLGCRLIPIPAVTGASKLNSLVTITNYADFRWIAYNTKVVFYVENPQNPPEIFFLTMYQGMAIGFSLSVSSSQGSNEPNSGGAFTRYEKLEFQSAYAVKSGTNFNINFRIKNTGSADATIDMLFFNGIPDVDLTGVVTLPPGMKGTTLKPGDEQSYQITLTGGTTFKSGMSVEIKLQTVAGNSYPKVVVLP